MNEDKYWEEQRIANDPQEEKVYFNCDLCGAEIYKGQEYYDCDAGYLCEKCFDEEQEMYKQSCERIAGDDDGD